MENKLKVSRYIRVFKFEELSERVQNIIMLKNNEGRIIPENRDELFNKYWNIFELNKIYFLYDGTQIHEMFLDNDYLKIFDTEAPDEVKHVIKTGVVTDGKQNEFFALTETAYDLPIDTHDKVFSWDDLNDIIMGKKTFDD